MRGNGETPSSLGSSQGAHHQHQYQGVISQVTCGSSCIFAAIIGGRTNCLVGKRVAVGQFSEPGSARWPQFSDPLLRLVGIELMLLGALSGLPAFAIIMAMKFFVIFQLDRYDIITTSIIDAVLNSSCVGYKKCTMVS